ncbi:MAG TPA: 50S ribosomal protein L4, partial [Chlamydiales bacterium]|nr:50S ribosomal protein L4 [Chlamydiales bacterium]
ASTKTRAEINRTGKKPHPQKGGGRARQGDLAAPHYKGGGIVFGPRPKFDQHVRINKKERRSAIVALIAEKMRENRVCILGEEEMKAPKTKTLAQFFHQVEIGPKRALILGAPSLTEGGENLRRSLSNLPKKEYSPVTQLNGYILARCRDLVILESAWDAFLAMLKGGSRE